MGTKSNRVLSIQSHVVHGYVGNKCAVFPLQVLGYDVDFINSVQFSNHTQYNCFKGQVLTEHELGELFSGLESNDLVDYSHILTGYVGSESFLRKTGEIARKIKAKCPDSIYLCDPVLGDNGHFYVPETLIDIYKKEILPIADITTPNNFELEKLTGMKVSTEEETLLAMGELHKTTGVPIIVLTSLDSSGPKLSTFVSHQKKQNEEEVREVWKIEYEKFNCSFTGTGDLFSALFLGWFSKSDSSIPIALENTIGTMGVVLAKTKEVRKLASEKCKELKLVQSLREIQEPFQYISSKAVQIYKS